MSNSHSGSEVARRTRRKFLFGALLVLLFPVLGAVINSLVLDRAVRDSVRALRAATSALPKRASSSEDWFPLIPFTLPELPAGAPLPAESERQAIRSVSPGSTTRRSTKLAVPRPLPKSVSASKELVLRWAHQRMAPQGKSAPAEGSMPAGIELFGVAPLGIGLLDGDRLVSIGGAPVSERSQVVEHVLAARARREDRIEVGLVRRTQAGPVAFSVTVNQPYSDTDTTPVSAE